MLFGLVVVAILVCLAGVVVNAPAQTNAQAQTSVTIKNVKLVKGPNGHTEVESDGTLPEGVQAVQVTPQPDGKTCKVQYFATKADFEAAIGQHVN